MTKMAAMMMVLRRGASSWRMASTTSNHPVTRTPSSLFSSFSLSTNVAANAAAHFSNEGILLADSPPSPTAAAPTLLQPEVIIYDGVCHLCHGEVKWEIKVDKIARRREAV